MAVVYGIAVLEGLRLRSRLTAAFATRPEKRSKNRTAASYKEVNDAIAGEHDQRARDITEPDRSIAVLIMV